MGMSQPTFDLFRPRMLRVQLRGYTFSKEGCNARGQNTRKIAMGAYCVYAQHQCARMQLTPARERNMINGLAPI
eukprot:6194077-Pleurochrysis_carterae.AAC.2